MKSEKTLAVILFFIALVACVPVYTPAPTDTPSLTATSTTTSILATSTPKPISTVTQVAGTSFANEKASDDCFFNIDFTPEKTEMNEVVAAWGNPSSRDSFGKDYEYWYFDSVGVPYISFKNQVIDTISYSLKDCSLGKVISKLGPPEKVEITVLVSDIDLSTSFTQYFHYSSLGFAFYRPCDETQNCFAFQADDMVNGKEFYSADKVIEDSTGFNMASYVYKWHGFGVDVEQVENKIKDFVTTTPMP